VKLPRTVLVLGVVSFFNDLASEIVVPLIPILLTSVLGAGPVALGLIEGVADAVAAWLKLWSGRRSDQLGGKRKALAVAGYALSNLARPLLGLAGSWVTVLLLRSVDRVGKGLRTAPRDALVADATPARIRGYAYGFHRALDNAGAVGGSLIAAAVLAFSAVSLPQLILLSAIPGLLAVLCLVLGVRETPTTPPAAQARRVRPEGAGSITPKPQAPTTLPSAGGPVLGEEGTGGSALAWRALDLPMRRYLAVLGLFTLARASETFILLLGHDQGATIVEVLLLWAMLNFAKATTSTLGGRLADRLGRGGVLVASWLSFAIAFALYGRVDGPLGLWLVTLGYGLFAGLGEGAERAVVADFAGERSRGAAFGWYNLVAGLAAIPAGLLFGTVWHFQGAAAAFTLAAAVALAAVVLLRAWAWPRRAVLPS
jgi:MFS family permease